MEAVANKDKEKENNRDDEFDTPGKGKRKRKSAGLWSRQVDIESLVGLCGFYVLNLFSFFFCCCLRSRCVFSFSGGGEEKVINSPTGTPKKTKVEPYKLTSQQKSLIKSDEANEKLWNEVLDALKDGPVYNAFVLPK